MKRSRVTALAAAAVVVASLPSPAAFGMDMPMETPAAPPGITMPADKPVEAAQVAVDKETAIAVARKHFNIPAELGEPHAQLYESGLYNAFASWHLNWYPDEKTGDRRSYRVTVNANTGRIVDFSYHGYPVESMALKYTRNEALAEAKVWLEKLVPDLLGELELNDHPLAPIYYYGGSSAQHTFHWKRMHQGAQVTGQGTSISIDAITGEMVGFSVTVDKQVVMKQPEERVSILEAAETFAEALVMEMGYKYFYTPGTNEGDWRVVYQLKGTPVMDAATGALYYGNRLYDRAQFAAGALADLGEKPAVGIQRPWTREEAIAVAHQVAGLDKDTPPTSVHFSEGKNPKPYMHYMISWELADETGEMWGKGYRYYSVNIDAQNNLVTAYHSYSYEDPAQYEGKEAVLDEAGARERILNFLKTHRSDLAGSLREVVNTYRWGRYPWEPVADDQSLRPTFEMTFQMMHNGLPLLDSNVGVSVNLFTGQLTNFYAYGQDLAKEKPLPATSGTMSEAEAIQALMEQFPLRSVWSLPPVTEPVTKLPMPGPIQRQAQTLHLFYQLGELHSHIFDAVSGHALDYSGRDLVLAATRPLDIEGHWAEREIELLLARGVFDPTGESFNPSGTVTQGDAVRWLVLSRGLQPFYRESYDFALAGNTASTKAAPFAQAAVTAGILNPVEFGVAFDAESAMSREEFALWAVRAMGYEKVAAMSPAIELNFADKAEIAAKYRNAVALLAGLDIIGSGEGVAYRPQSTLTRAEAAKMLYGVMSNTRGGYYLPYYGR